MLRRQLAVALRERPRAHSRLTWPDRAWLALLAGTLPAGRLAGLRLIEAARTGIRASGLRGSDTGRREELQGDCQPRIRHSPVPAEEARRRMVLVQAPLQAPERVDNTERADEDRRGRTVRGPAFSGPANLRLSYAVAFISRYSSMASCGVRYPIAE
jgi:hypothetical protein